MSVGEIRIVGWEKFQHYKNRNPPWIRLYRDLIDRPAWRSLSDPAARLLVELWILSADRGPGGIVSADPQGIAWATGKSVADNNVDSSLQELARQGFIELPDHASKGASKHESTHASKTVSPETEDRGQSSSSSSLRSEELWQVWVDELGGKRPWPRLTATRRKKLQAFADEHLSGADNPLGQFRLVLRAVKASPHHMSERAYQMPESLFRNEERRDRWMQAVQGNGQAPTRLSATA